MRPISVCFALVLALVASLPQSAAAWDAKAVSPGASCIAYGPDTTAAELQFTTSGIYNPGTSIEKVMCALPRDSENVYQNSNTISVEVFYRVLGAAPGRLTCTLFVGTVTQQTDAVTTTTSSGDLKSGNARGSVTVGAASQTFTTAFPPNTLVCAISPKTSLGSITVMEQLATNG